MLRLFSPRQKLRHYYWFSTSNEEAWEVGARMIRRGGRSCRRGMAAVEQQQEQEQQPQTETDAHHHHLHHPKQPCGNPNPKVKTPYSSCEHMIGRGSLRASDSRRPFGLTLDIIVLVRGEEKDPMSSGSTRPKLQSFNPLNPKAEVMSSAQPHKPRVSGLG